MEKNAAVSTSLHSTFVRAIINMILEKGKKKKKPSEAAKESKQNVNTEHNTMIRTQQRTAREMVKKNVPMNSVFGPTTFLSIHENKNRPNTLCEARPSQHFTHSNCVQRWGQYNLIVCYTKTSHSHHERDSCGLHRGCGVRGRRYVVLFAL